MGCDYRTRPLEYDDHGTTDDEDETKRDALNACRNGR